ncbi:hypothetical protein NKH18_06515 [Streptomyces sp. M10(2022)]
MPDPVRTAAVRAVLITSLTIIQAMVAFLSTLAGSWLAFPMVLSGVGSTVVATWSVLDVWVTRQVWNQRNGVVSVPSSTARQIRRERRRARRAARTAAREAGPIRAGAQAAFHRPDRSVLRRMTVRAGAPASPVPTAAPTTPRAAAVAARQALRSGRRAPPRTA